MGISEEAAQARAEAAARRAEARAELAAARAAAQAQAAQAQEEPPLVAATAAAQWDPLGDDPRANHDDGRAHPDEDAIADRQASHDAKFEAWRARAERLFEQGKVFAGLEAESHMEWHEGRIERP